MAETENGKGNRVTYDVALLKTGEATNKTPVILAWYQGPAHKDTGNKGTTQFYFWGYDEAPPAIPDDLTEHIETSFTKLYGYPIAFQSCQQLNANDIQWAP